MFSCSLLTGGVRSSILGTGVVLSVAIAALGGCSSGAPEYVNAVKITEEVNNTIADLRHLPPAAIRPDANIISQAVAIIHDEYVSEVSDDRLERALRRGVLETYDNNSEASPREFVEGAMRSMTTVLDKYSAFLDAEAYAELNEETDGRFGGLGIEVGMKDEMVTILSVFDDSPARTAGLQPGDVIVSIDGRQLGQTTLKKAVSALRGDVGEPVLLGLDRGGRNFSRSIVRDIVEVRSVSADRKGDIGYLKISVFNAHTSRDLRRAVQDMARNGGNVKIAGYIMDLRDNPGGLFDQAIEVSDDFLDRGVIVSTRGRHDSESFSSTKGDMVAGAPIVVLINRNSASAAEIVSKALHDQHRALLVGERSYGKGSVQTIFPMSGQRGLKITTAKYYGPDGNSVDGGIDPDRIAVDDPDTVPDEALDAAMGLIRQAIAETNRKAVAESK